ncbi:MAG: SRPBCC family protein, partial [Flavisolibacter sp.]
SSSKLNDEFIINHPGLHYSKQKVVELIPGRRVVWLVTDSNLRWLKNNKQEWTDTKMIFEIAGDGENTTLTFQHEGLSPDKECYEACSNGWDLVIDSWLLHFISFGKPSEEMEKAAEIRNKRFEHKPVNKDFHRSTTVNVSPGEAMDKISQVNRWWKQDFRGSAQNLNDRFTVPFGDPSFVDFVVSEFVRNKKMVWKVTDCYLPWFENKKEWNGTEVVFELLEEDGKTKIDFTHVGLVPGIECYEVCEKGWNGHIDTLARFINEGNGLPL